jgi:disulfide bond formation protein DsbB
MSLETFNLFIGIGTLVIAFLVVVLIIFRLVIGSNSSIFNFIYNNALWIGLFLGIGAIIGSLTYSDIYMLPPCLYCWWQRIFLYPQVVLFAVALWRKRKNTSNTYEIFYYSLPMVVISSLISLYHVFLQQGVIASTGACLQNGVSCTTIDISIFGFLTIPMMALVLGTSLTLLGILVLNKKTFSNL